MSGLVVRHSQAKTPQHGECAQFTALSSPLLMSIQVQDPHGDNGIQ